MIELELTIFQFSIYIHITPLIYKIIEKEYIALKLTILRLINFVIGDELYGHFRKLG